MSVVNDRIEDRKFQALSEYRRNAPDVLDLESAARYLGLSSRSLKDAVKDKQIPCRVVGRTYIFSRDALNRWVGDSGNEL